jgi:hypothetical protein
MKNRIFFAIIFVTILSLGSVESTSNATMVKRLSEDDMTNQAKTIVTGRVLATKSEWNEERTKIYTYITISTQTFLKGDDQPQEMVIKKLGGEVGDIGMLVEGTSVFEEGEEVLLFLRKGRKGFHRILGFSQGKFSIETDPVSQRKMLIKKKARMVRTQDGRIGKKIFKIKSDKTMFLDDLTSRIQNIVKQKHNNF